MVKADIFVSIIAAVYNEADVLEPFVVEAVALLNENYSNFELVIVDDGSDDATMSVMERALKTQPCVRYVRLAKRYGREMAVAAGLDTVIGDYAVIMSPSEDPLRIVPDAVSKAAAGTGIIFGIRDNKDSESWTHRIGAKLFYWYCKRFLSIEMPRRLTGMAVLSRQAINSLIKVRGKSNYLRLFQKYTGLPSQTLSYHPALRTGGRASKEGFWRMASTAIDIAVSNSSHPLRFASYLGLIAGGLNLAYMIYVVAVFFVKDDVQPGWTTSSLQSAAMFFLIFVILAVFAEYLGKLMNETVPKDVYTVMFEKNSSKVLANKSRLNVVERTEREKYEQTHA